MEIGGSIQPFRQKKRGRERGGKIEVRPGGSVRLPSARPLRHAHRVLLDAQAESFFRPCAHPALPNVSPLTNLVSRSAALWPL
jgi:hypothetical protein